MSIINQMLKDLEERKESAIKGQDGIISRNRVSPRGGRLPLILLTLISITLLVAVIYLLWLTRADIASRQQVEEYLPQTTKQAEPSTIAALIEQSNAGDSRPAEEPSEQSEPSGVVVQPKKVVRANPIKPVIIAPQPRQSVEPTPTKSNRATQADQQANLPTVSINRLVPSELKGSWQKQTLTILGKNFHPDSEVLICWPAKCVTLKGYRINYISPSELNITLTTGTREERWHLTVLNPDGGASNAKEFMVSSPPTSEAVKQAELPENSPENDRNIEPAVGDDRLDSISKRIIPLSAFQQAEEYYLEANRLEREHKSAQALVLWEKAVLLAPEHHSSRQSLIDKLIASARTVEAEGHIKQGIKLFPNYPIYVQKLAQIRMSQGELPIAIAIIEDSIQQGVVNADLYAFAAALYQREKSYQKSIEHYQRALTLNPTNGTWWMGLGISFEQNAQESEALSAFKQAQNSGTLSRKLNSYVKKQITLLNQKIATQN
ncbi:MAG: tetratricopeptide repeat protein [Gammaproteobacteria bacterium]|nr:tetratricopeptide repeat protein [Gammaproteobacteria bacterium]